MRVCVRESVCVSVFVFFPVFFAHSRTHTHPLTQNNGSFIKGVGVYQNKWGFFPSTLLDFLLSPTHPHTHIHARTHARKRYTNSRTNTHTHAPTHTHANTYTHIRTHTHTHTYTHTNTHTDTQTHARTHARIHACSTNTLAPIHAH